MIGMADVVDTSKELSELVEKNEIIAAGIPGHKEVTNLLSDQGRKLSIQRNVDVESVFGQLKHNWGFRRFLLKGKEKVRTEWGILCIAHNIAKLAVQ